MLRQLRLDILLLIVITAVVSVLILNATSDYSPFERGISGIPAGSVIQWGQETASDAPSESTPEAASTEAADEQPTEEATEAQS